MHLLSEKIFELLIYRSLDWNWATESQNEKQWLNYCDLGAQCKHDRKKWNKMWLCEYSELRQSRMNTHMNCELIVWRLNFISASLNKISSDDRSHKQRLFIRMQKLLINHLTRYSETSKELAKVKQKLTRDVKLNARWPNLFKWQAIKFPLGLPKIPDEVTKILWNSILDQDVNKNYKVQDIFRSKVLARLNEWPRNHSVSTCFTFAYFLPSVVLSRSPAYAFDTDVFHIHNESANNKSSLRHNSISYFVWPLNF